MLSELEGVIIRSGFVVVLELELELDRECCFVLRGSAKDLFVVVSVTAPNQVPHTHTHTISSRRKYVVTT